MDLLVSKWSLFLEKRLGLERDQVAMPVTSMPVASVQTGVPMSDDSLVPAIEGVMLKLSTGVIFLL